MSSARSTTTKLELTDCIKSFKHKKIVNRIKGAHKK